MRRSTSSRPPAADWATNGGDYGQTRYSSLKEITKANVRRLKLKWHVHLNGSGTGSKYKGEGTPLVYKGIMYTVTGAGDVFALDATNGTILWQYGADMPQAMNTVCCGWVNRGLALGDGKVYVARLDATLVALAQQTGRVVWSVSNGNWQDGYTMTMAPLYYNGLVIVGVSGGEYGARGSVTAYDARDGHLVWRFYTIPSPGQPGSATWPPNDEWKTGGAPVWNTPSVDPKLGLLYFTTGNAFPWSSRGPGDNLYTASFVALNPMTGAYAWHYQVVHHDIWDYDCSSNTVLFATGNRGPRAEGRRRAVQDRLGVRARPAERHAGRPDRGEAGAAERVPAHVADAADSRRETTSPSNARSRALSRSAPPTAGPSTSAASSRRSTSAASPRLAPGAGGGNTWSPASYNPKTGNLYVCSRDTQSAYKAIGTISGSPPPGRAFLGVEMSFPNVKGIIHRRLDRDEHVDNRIVWRHRYTKTAFNQTDASCESGSLTTAGGLVFVGMPQGMYHGVVAYNAATGARLWRFHTDAGVGAPPMTYSVGGEQYVAVYAGGRATRGIPVVKGDDVYAFALR